MIFIPPERLIQSLKNAGYPQRKIAQMVGASDAQISHIVNGDVGVSLSLYMALYAVWEKVIEEATNGK